MKVSVIVPVYNEEPTVGEVVRRLLDVPFAKEVIVVNDGSTDGTREALEEFAGVDGVALIDCERNAGKGAAVRLGLERATGEYILVQDADLELFPEEIPRLLAPVEVGRSQVVYGSRFAAGRGRASRRNHLANRLITGWANCLYGSELTDVSTAYKLVPRSLLEGLDLRCRGFEFCTELTAKLLRSEHSIEEVPVTYRPRSGDSGKKLSYLRDGLKAAWTLLRWRLWRPQASAAPTPCPASTNPKP